MHEIVNNQSCAAIETSVIEKKELLTIQYCIIDAILNQNKNN